MWMSSIIPFDMLCRCDCITSNSLRSYDLFLQWSVCMNRKWLSYPCCFWWLSLSYWCCCCCWGIVLRKLIVCNQIPNNQLETGETCKALMVRWHNNLFVLKILNLYFIYYNFQIQFQLNILLLTFSYPECIVWLFVTFYIWNIQKYSNAGLMFETHVFLFYSWLPLSIIPHLSRSV